MAALMRIARRGFETEARWPPRRWLERRRWRRFVATTNEALAERGLPPLPDGEAEPVGIKQLADSASAHSGAPTTPPDASSLAREVTLS